MGGTHVFQQPRPQLPPVRIHDAELRPQLLPRGGVVGCSDALAQRLPRQLQHLVAHLREDVHDVDAGSPGKRVVGGEDVAVALVALVVEMQLACEPLHGDAHGAGAALAAAGFALPPLRCLGLGLVRPGLLLFRGTGFGRLASSGRLARGAGRLQTEVG